MATQLLRTHHPQQNGRECLFGEIEDGEMVLNDAGRMVQTVWDEIPENYSGVEIDEFVIMPSHINGIVVLVGATPCGRPDTGKVGQSTAFDLSFLAIAFAK